MAKAGRGSDQFMVRLPEGMREALKNEADVNGRSMNAEIVSRLEAFSDLELFRGMLLTANEQKEHLEQELEKKKTEFDEIKVERDRALIQVSVVDQLLKSMKELQNLLDDRLQITDDVFSILKFIDTDNLCLRAELDGEVFIPSAVSPKLKASTSEYLCNAIDLRTELFARLAIIKKQEKSDFSAKELMKEHAIQKVN